MNKIPDNQKSKGLMIRNSTAEFLMFIADSRQDGLEVRFQDETVWLTQKLMAELFQCSSDNVSLHLKNIFKDGELEKKSVTEEFSVTASDGKQYRIKHYNLDAIIAVGYRMEKSSKGKNSKIRCIYCQELLKQRRDRSLGSHCEYVSGLRRRSSETQNSHDNGGLVQKAGRLS